MSNSENTSNHAKVLILGSGPAGYTAALYAARANLKPMLITGIAQGGQLMTTTEVDNWPADVAGVQGPDLMARFLAHAERFDTKIVFDHINKVDFSSSPVQADRRLRHLHLRLADPGHRRLGQVPGPAGPRRPSWAAASAAAPPATGFSIAARKSCVVGGGNTAVEEALYLSNIASKVHPDPSAQQVPGRGGDDRQADAQGQGRQDPAAPGSAVATKCWAIPPASPACAPSRSRARPTPTSSVKGCFIAIGHHPNTDIFQGHLEMKDGYLLTKGGSEGFATQTSIPGIFAAGDVQDHVYRQAITSAGTGCMAAPRCPAIPRIPRIAPADNVRAP